MNITCTFNDIKAICKDASNLIYGGVIVFVKSPTDGVTTAAFLNTARLGIIFTLSNTPSKNAFLAVYPDAIQVDSIT